MNRRHPTLASAPAIALALGFAAVFCPPTLAPAQNIKPDAAAVPTRIGFGSCVKQGEPQPIWDAIVKADPQEFVLIGDNIYGDSQDMEILKQKYGMLGAEPGFMALRAKRPILATWDDHDYGQNDGGADYPMRAESQKVFLDFFGDPPDSPRRSRPGVYISYEFGPADKRVQLILLDARYFRSPLLTNKTEKRPGFGPYIPNDDPAATVLGDAQWKWLEGELRKPARVRLIASSYQFLSEFTGVEAWANFPRERKRMIDLIRSARAEGVIFLSGDVHFTEISHMETPGLYPLLDFTSSGFSHTIPVGLPNKRRVSRMISTKKNFGLIDFDWAPGDPTVTLRAVGETGGTLYERAVKLSELGMGAASPAAPASE